jgi:hypothetical protein
MLGGPLGSPVVNMEFCLQLELLLDPCCGEAWLSPVRGLVSRDDKCWTPRAAVLRSCCSALTR